MESQELPSRHLGFHTEYVHESSDNFNQQSSDAPATPRGRGRGKQRGTGKSKQNSPVTPEKSQQSSPATPEYYLGSPLTSEDDVQNMGKIRKSPKAHTKIFNKIARNLLGPGDIPLKRVGQKSQTRPWTTGTH